jgi:glycosidase
MARGLERQAVEAGDGSDALYSNDFFGGDLAGIIARLDYIAALGANVIYMTPVMTAASNHKYDTADYRHVDPRFGSDADFEHLCVEAAKRGIRILPDASLNHVGVDSLYFDRYGNFGGKGPSPTASATRLRRTPRGSPSTRPRATPRSSTRAGSACATCPNSTRPPRISAVTPMARLMA